jgi:tetratricopeptide (TPR) repeat protein
VFSKLPVFVAAGLLAVSSHISAATIDQLKILVDQGEYEKAYQLAQTQLDEYEGDPAFDLQYGIAAIDSGHISEGVFALDRVLLLEPNNGLAKLELARAYYQLGQFEKAQRLFEQVKRQNPPKNVLNRINQYLALIDKKTSIPPTQFTSFIELLAGYDSNINSGPAGQTNVVTLTDSALGRGDPFSQVRLGGNVIHPYAPDAALNFSFNADMRYYDTESAEDYRNITVSGGHTWYAENQQYLLNFTAQQYRLDNEDYRDMLGASVGWNYQLSRNAVLKSFLGINDLTYDDASWKDATQLSAGFNYLHGGSGSWNPIYFVGTFVGQEEPETAGILANGQIDRVFYGGNLGVQLSPGKNLTITPALTYQASDYQGDDWIYNRKREDELTLFNLNMAWTMSKAWMLTLNYSYTEADSNIELYEYDRQQVMLGLRYNFQ